MVDNLPALSPQLQLIHDRLTTNSKAAQEALKQTSSTGITQAFRDIVYGDTQQPISRG